MKPLLFSLYAQPAYVNKFMHSNLFDLGNLKSHDFPDGESYIKFNSDVKNKQVIFVAALDNPNSKFLPLSFALKTAKELGASNVGLVVPYLPYMRQDKQFLPGEAVTSKYFSKMLSESIDWLVTIDPHLHRHQSLSEIYSATSYVLHATSPISNWIQQHVSSPLIIGPDSESEQWVAEIANAIKAPFQVLKKVRKGDREVEITFPNLDQYKDLTPVLVDDIISTGTTLIETIKHLKEIKMKPAVCIGVHAVFSHHAYENIFDAGAKSVFTTNTIDDPSNAIDIVPLILQHLKSNLKL